MKRILAAFLVLGCMGVPGFAGDCPDGQLQFSFSNLKVVEAFENGVMHVSRK